MRKNGAEAFAFETIAVSGDASALPHGTPRNVKLRPGFLTMDFGAKFDGYCSDMTRTIVIGKADAEIKKLYNTVLKAQLAALDYLREGADCGEADKVARDIIDGVPEFNGTFGHSLGHSIGLYVHETPGLSKRGFGTKLAAGQVTSVEPGIYLFGKYGCRIEDMVAIEKDGVHNFTHSTKELIEIY
jgi:Xaa-Pro aminopeptidase